MRSRNALIALALLVSCSSSEEGANDLVGPGEVPDEVEVEVLLDGLNNPSGIDFGPDGRMLVCAAGPGREHGNGRVIVWTPEATEEYLTGFPTEFWKVGKDGQPDRFKLGPLDAAWLPNGNVIVSNGGLGDGADHLLVFTGPGDASQGRPTNAIPPTSDDTADKGEGNFTGFSLARDGERLFVCGQGSDAKTWLLVCDHEKAELSTFASADDNGIATNSPMDSLSWGGDEVLVLYSGAGGVDDGLVVSWSLKTRKPTAQWTLPGLTDPMGMDRIPGTNALAIVDNNWRLDAVETGRLAQVTLPPGGGEAKVELLPVELRGPTACRFGQDGRLYVTQLGPQIDAGMGSVIAIRER
ncbi:MAG: hypothetical protein AAF726_15780 [Planctomycetota bacterium]